MSYNTEKTGYPPPSQPQQYNQPAPGFPPNGTQTGPSYPSAGQPTGPPPGYGAPIGPGQPVLQGQPAGFGQSPVYPSNTVVVQTPQTFVAHTGVRPQDYLILSIISVFFCWPMAICAIMYSLNSRNAADINDFARAECLGRTARNIGIAAIVVGCVLVAVIVGANAAITATYYCYGYYGC